jgi:RNA-directed DNA polymerase
MIGLQDRRRVNNRPAKQLWLPFAIEGGLFTTETDTASPVEDERPMERIVDRENLLTALRNVKRNGGSPGIDGMTVEDLPDYLERNWLKIRWQLMSGTYVPRPVKRVEIPKPGGGI